MAPKNGTPLFIEFVKRSVATAQPVLEGASADRTVAAVAELVVNLPADNGRMACAVLGHLCHQAPGAIVIDQVVRAVLAAIAERRTPSVLAHEEEVGALDHQPRRW